MSRGDAPVSVQVEQPLEGTPRARTTRTSYPPPGPVAEGAGAGIGPLAAAPAKGSGKRKTLLILSGLVVLAALICGVGFFVFLRDTGDSSPSNATPGDEATESGEEITDRGVAATAPVSEDAEDDVEELSDAESPTSATVPTSAPAAALQTIPVDASMGSYDAVFDLGVVPVAVAVLPSGKVLCWAAESEDDFYRQARYIEGGGGSGKTYFAEWDPTTNEVSQLVVSETDHDMFCPGISMLANGDIVVTGGQNADKTSIYQLATGEWIPAEDMHISRGYASSTTLSDGRVFVLGGSWSGLGDVMKDGEIYDPDTGEWTLMAGIQAAFILTDDPEDAEDTNPITYRSDNYGWFFGWSDATVFHAGPSTEMHWFSTDGTGSALIAGTRPGGNSANGNAIMYDKGKILACGGSEAFALEDYPATSDASLITIGKANQQVQVKELSPMNLERVYSNAAVLPDGKVLITGGASNPLEFSDKYALFQPEIWDPATEEFTLMEAKHVQGRTYHSTAALLPDGRVFTGGGGLCGSDPDTTLCKEDPDEVNHLDMEIFNPPYLFAADGTLAPRPTIELSAKTAKHGGSLTVTSSEQLMMVSMIRMSSATHSTNTDQRRIEMCGPFTTACAASPIQVTIDEDPGVVLPGNWMFFGVNADGVPSVASIVNIGTV